MCEDIIISNNIVKIPLIDILKNKNCFIKKEVINLIKEDIRTILKSEPKIFYDYLSPELINTICYYKTIYGFCRNNNDLKIVVKVLYRILVTHFNKECLYLIFKEIFNIDIEYKFLDEIDLSNIKNILTAIQRGK